ncbi:helix-turn-helix transcriptional regulator [Amycolatopsis sp. NPDC049253]|uniref:helix-turn-helix transcriptional regulator n=1 Tax=Amycolatopsis sp. NPDC049253 TaxID=3155274 RepID=UPI00342FB549
MSEIGEFLQARRARVSPESKGLPAAGRRKVPGLRREELALLSGVSVDYYTRLEQGRADAVSDSVLDSIARTLGLDATERDHLRLLARPPRDPDAAPAQSVRPGVRDLVDGMGVPAFVAGRWQEILVANPLGEAVLPPSMGPGTNAARHVFLNPEALEYYVDWPDVAAETVANLRHESARHPGDAVLAKLVGELTIASPVFTDLWSRHDVQAKSHGLKRLRHPRAGVLVLGYESLHLPDTEDQLIVTYTARDRSTADALALLAAEAASAPAAAG